MASHVKRETNTGLQIDMPQSSGRTDSWLRRALFQSYQSSLTQEPRDSSTVLHFLAGSENMNKNVYTLYSMTKLEWDVVQIIHWMYLLAFSVLKIFENMTNKYIGFKHITLTIKSFLDASADIYGDTVYLQWANNVRYLQTLPAVLNELESIYTLNWVPCN